MSEYVHQSDNTTRNDPTQDKMTKNAYAGNINALFGLTSAVTT